MFILLLFPCFYLCGLHLLLEMTNQHERQGAVYGRVLNLTTQGKTIQGTLRLETTGGRNEPLMHKAPKHSRSARSTTTANDTAWGKIDSQRNQQPPKLQRSRDHVCSVLSRCHSITHTSDLLHCLLVCTIICGIKKFPHCDVEQVLKHLHPQWGHRYSEPTQTWGEPVNSILKGTRTRRTALSTAPPWSCLVQWSVLFN